jgi:hypothetical protein
MAQAGLDKCCSEASGCGRPDQLHTLFQLKSPNQVRIYPQVLTRQLSRCRITLIFQKDADMIIHKIFPKIKPSYRIRCFYPSGLFQPMK